MFRGRGADKADYRGWPGCGAVPRAKARTRTGRLQLQASLVGFGPPCHSGLNNYQRQCCDRKTMIVIRSGMESRIEPSASKHVFSEPVPLPLKSLAVASSPCGNVGISGDHPVSNQALLPQSAASAPSIRSTPSASSHVPVCKICNTFLEPLIRRLHLYRRLAQNWDSPCGFVLGKRFPSNITPDLHTAIDRPVSKRWRRGAGIGRTCPPIPLAGPSFDIQVTGMADVGSVPRTAGSTRMCPRRNFCPEDFAYISTVSPIATSRQSRPHPVIPCL